MWLVASVIWSLPGLCAQAALTIASGVQTDLTFGLESLYTFRVHVCPDCCGSPCSHEGEKERRKGRSCTPAGII